MLRSLCLVAFLAAAARAEEPLLPKKADAAPKGIKAISLSFDPVEAKPGQTVTLKFTVELEKGFTTYPVKQPEQSAAGMVNKVEFPKAGALVFVGETADPADFKTKAEPDLGVKELRYLEGKVVYSRKFVVNPSQAEGEVTVKLPGVKLMVCDANNCYPGKALTPEAKFKVLAGPAVAVEKEFADEVRRALAAKDEKK